MERERAQPTDRMRFEVRALDGTVVAIKVRQDFSDGRKTFWWEQSNGTKGLGDRSSTSLPLYGTERLSNAEPDALVILCEGEKKARALTSRGFLALGTVTGAKPIPDDDVLRSLLERPVILWADNDRDGHRHMRRIAERLKTLGHTDVKMLPWPEAPIKGDAVDFFELGGTVESLNGLIARAAPLAEIVRTPAVASPRSVTAPPAGTLAEIHQRTTERQRRQRQIMLTNPSPEDVEAWQRQREQERRAEEEAAQRAAQLQQIEALLHAHIDAHDPYALLSTLRESELSLEERSPYVTPFIGMIAFLPRTDQDVLVADAQRVFHVSTVTMREQIAALNAPLQGPSLVQDPPPWPDEINGAELLNAMANQFTNFLVLPDHGADALALWCLFSYCLDAFDIAPILTLQSPTKRCGKTRALEILGIFVRRPISVSNISSAALYRITEQSQPTLIADEGDTFMGGDKGELHGVFNSSWSRTAASVIRTVGDAHEPKVFSTWGAKVIALIGALLDTMQDRSIPIPMRRRLKHERIAKLRRPERNALRELELNRQALRWATDHVETLERRDPAIPVELEDDDRAADNWSVLLAIADEVGGDWPDRARVAAVALSGGERRVEDRSARIELLRDLHTLSKGRQGQDKIASEDIVKWLTMTPGTWSLYNHGKPITKNQVASLLEHFEIRPRTIRTETGTPRGYRWSDFADPFARYLSSEPLPQPQQPQQVNKISYLGPKIEVQQDASVAGPKSELSAGKNSDVASVAGEKSEPKTKRTPVSVPKIKRTPVGAISVAGQDATTRPKRTPVH